MKPPPKHPRKRRIPHWQVGLIVGMGMVIAYLIMGLFTHPERIVRVSHANEKLQAAARQAQAELGDFIKAVGNPGPDQHFAIRGSFPTSEGPEYLWVRDVKFADGKFEGQLDQPPLLYHDAKKGDTVRVEKKDVFDWMIRENGQIKGGYTEKALTR